MIWKWNEVAQSCPTLCDPMDSSLPGFFVYGVFQARVLEWAAISFSRYHVVFVFPCFTSLCIIPRSICVAVNGIASFFFMAE